MIETMVMLTSISSNVHRVIDDNNDLYRKMVMNVMRMTWDYVGKCPIIDKELNADMFKFFLFFKRLQRTIMGYVHKSQ